MMNIVVMLIRTAGWLLDAARLLPLVISGLLILISGHSWMLLAIVDLAVGIELFTRPIANFLAILWVAAALTLPVGAAISPAIRSHRRSAPARGRLENRTERRPTQAFKDLVEGAALGVVLPVVPTAISGFLLSFALVGLHSLGSSEIISWPTFRILGYGLIATACAGPIAGSVWLIRYLQSETSGAEDKTAEAEKP